GVTPSDGVVRGLVEQGHARGRRRRSGGSPEPVPRRPTPGWTRTAPGVRPPRRRGRGGRRPGGRVAAAGRGRGVTPAVTGSVTCAGARHPATWSVNGPGQP